MVTTWECVKCKKPNYYSKPVHRNEDLLIEMKILGPKKVTVECKHCSEKQIIEVYD